MVIVNEEHRQSLPRYSQPKKRLVTFRPYLQTAEFKSDKAFVCWWVCRMTIHASICSALLANHLVRALLGLALRSTYCTSVEQAWA